VLLDEAAANAKKKGNISAEAEDLQNQIYTLQEHLAKQLQEVTPKEMFELETFTIKEKLEDF
jgi:hypothetical protein